MAISSGTIKFDSPAGEVSPALTCRQFAETALGQSAAMTLDAMRTRFILEHATTAGRTFQVTITYENQALSQVELFLLLPGEKAGWENWSQETEQRRKQESECWLAEVFAQPVAVLPLELDGQWITPFEQNWETLRGIRFPWGEARSYFDGKAGFAGLLVRYAHP